MMGYAGWTFWGMHLFWWMLWVVLIVGGILLLARRPEGAARRRETPIELLQRRYAAGEISAEEYEARKTRLERDAHLIG